MASSSPALHVVRRSHTQPRRTGTSHAKPSSKERLLQTGVSGNEVKERLKVELANLFDVEMVA